MRRPTAIILVVLFVLILLAAIAQLVIATGERTSYEGPTSPGQLPSLTTSPQP
jgi:hypothetical protein